MPDWWFGTGFFPHILGTITPTDYIIFSEGLKPPTSMGYNGRYSRILGYGDGDRVCSQSCDLPYEPFGTEVVARMRGGWLNANQGPGAWDRRCYLHHPQ